MEEENDDKITHLFSKERRAFIGKGHKYQGFLSFCQSVSSSSPNLSFNRPTLVSVASAMHCKPWGVIDEHCLWKMAQQLNRCWHFQWIFLRESQQFNLHAHPTDRWLFLTVAVKSKRDTASKVINWYQRFGTVPVKNLNEEMFNKRK